MFNSFLLAIDINDPASCERPLGAAQMMQAANPGAELHVLVVVPDTGMSIVSAALGPEHSAKAKAAAKAGLEAWAAEVLPSDHDAKLHVVEGTIYDQIIATAKQLGNDAIIVGANRPELRDYLVGPNAARVVRHSEQSVFVIR